MRRTVNRFFSPWTLFSLWNKEADVTAERQR